MKSGDIDIVIIGAGLTGLSLAQMPRAKPLIEDPTIEKTWPVQRRKKLRIGFEIRFSVPVLIAMGYSNAKRAKKRSRSTNW